MLRTSATLSTCSSSRQKGLFGIKEVFGESKSQLQVSSSDSLLIIHTPYNLSLFFCTQLLLPLFFIPPTPGLSLSPSPYFLRKMEGEEENEKRRRKFKSICVFCGSRTGYKSAFSDAAVELGKKLVERNIGLVYGGGSGGLMGLISKTVHDGGCHVLGVIPKALLPHEISGETVGQVKTVVDMHQRKSEMAKHAEAFIALPGGYGTMEELLEIIAWSQLGIHEKPVGLLNVDGYYDSLLALFDKGVEDGFIEGSARNIMVASNTAQELINKMEEYAPLHDRVAPRQSWDVNQLLDPTTSGKDQNPPPPLGES